MKSTIKSRCNAYEYADAHCNGNVTVPKTRPKTKSPAARHAPRTLLPWGNRGNPRAGTDRIRNYRNPGGYLHGRCPYAPTAPRCEAELRLPCPICAPAGALVRLLMLMSDTSPYFTLLATNVNCTRCSGHKEHYLH